MRCVKSRWTRTTVKNLNLSQYLDGWPSCWIFQLLQEPSWGKKQKKYHIYATCRWQEQMQTAKSKRTWILLYCYRRTEKLKKKKFPKFWCKYMNISIFIYIFYFICFYLIYWNWSRRSFKMLVYETWDNLGRVSLI